MSELCREETAFQQGQNYRLVFDRLPGVVVNCSSVYIPGIQSGNASVDTMFKSIPFSGSTAEYEHLSVTFNLTESWSNYKLIFNWIKGLTFPDSFDQFSALNSSENGLESDCSIIAYNGSNLPTLRINFKDAFPLTLTGVNLESVIEQPEPISVTASFQFLTYDFE